MAIALKARAREATRSVPEGTYRATLTGVHPFENAYGERIGFEFTLEDKGVEGLKVMQSTAPNWSVAGKLAALLRGLLARELTPTELATGVDLQALVGIPCAVLVLTASDRQGSAYSHVERVFPPDS